MVQTWVSGIHFHVNEASLVPFRKSTVLFAASDKMQGSKQNPEF